jgi:hypothetical protein
MMSRMKRQSRPSGLGLKNNVNSSIASINSCSDIDFAPARSAHSSSRLSASPESASQQSPFPFIVNHLTWEDDGDEYWAFIGVYDALTGEQLPGTA